MQPIVARVRTRDTFYILEAKSVLIQSRAGKDGILGLGRARGESHLKAIAIVCRQVSKYDK